MNTAAFLADQRRYFDGAYEQFCAFGGPCVYFHHECLRAGELAFLSDRHLEMLYATLTAWGMHRMGDADTTKTKLTNWEAFRDSLRECGEALKPMQGLDMLGLTRREYADAVSALAPCYRSLRLSVSGATVVVNSKALFHLLPHLVPPIDRQYTVRFFKRSPDKWRDAKGKFRQIVLPAGIDAQFELFCSLCLGVKDLADRVDASLFEHQRSANSVTPPKAIDNAIVTFVRITSGGELPVV